MTGIYGPGNTSEGAPGAMSLNTILSESGVTMATKKAS